MSAPIDPAPPEVTSPADVGKLADHVQEIRSILERLDPASRRLLADLLREPEPSEPRPARRGTFGMFAGQFSIGPEFFEPLPDEELRAWGEI